MGYWPNLFSWLGSWLLGQPHILVRFMAISDAKELKKSTNIAMVWVILSPYGSHRLGLIGHVYMLPDVLVGTDAETVFLIMTERLFTPFCSRSHLVCSTRSYYEYRICTVISNSFCYF